MMWSVTRHVICGMALLTCSISWSAESNRSLQAIQVPAIAPSTVFFDGKKNIGLKNFKGQFLLVNFWATWCAPCIREMPSLDRLAKKMAGKNLLVLAISEDDDSPAQVKLFAEKLKLKSLTMLYDTHQHGSRDFGLRGIPATFLISPKGRVLANLEGSAVWDEGKLYNEITDYLEKYR